MSQKLTSRCWELVTDIKHPDTGEQLIDVNTIDSILQTKKTVMSYGWIIHDEDVYNTGDEQKNPKHKCGTKKNDHVHIVIKCSRAESIDTVAKWFNFEDKLNFLEKKTNGRGKRDAYLDCLIYLTHEDEAQQKAGKHLYGDDQVHFFHQEGFTFRKFITYEKEAAKTRAEKYGKADISFKDQLRYEVLYNGMTISQLRKDHKLEYIDDMDALKRFRGDYLQNCPPPPYRINIYINGQAGSGKSLISKVLARAIIDPDGEMDDDDIYCCVSGDSSVTFESYDGQPVLIWDDFRSAEIMTGSSRSRGNVFKIFAVNPEKTIEKKKYSSVNLVNRVNIVNSVQPDMEFLNGLTGEYTDSCGNVFTSEEKYKAQSYRRFPILIEVYEKSYDITINKGFFGIGQVDQWVTIIPNIDVNFKEMVVACGGNKKLYNKLSAMAVKPVIDIFKRAEEILSHSQKGTDEEIMAKYADLEKSSLMEDMINGILDGKLPEVEA